MCSFFSNIFTKLNEGMAVFNILEGKNNKKSSEKMNFLSRIKKLLEKNNKCLIEYKKENIILKTKLKELLLYINKLKKDFGEKNEKIKEKIKKIYENYGKNSKNGKNDGNGNDGVVFEVENKKEI